MKQVSECDPQDGGVPFETPSELPTHVWEYCNIKHFSIGNPDFRVSLVLLEPHHTEKEVWHQQSGEVAIVRKGIVDANVGSHSRRLKEGDLVYIPRNTLHSFRAYEGPAELFVIHSPAVSPDKDHQYNAGS